MKKGIFIVLIAVVVLLAGCRSVEYITVEPEPIDIEPQKQMIFDTKPDNHKYNLVLEIRTVEDIVHNSGEYFRAWTDWETYALSLEDFIEKVQEKISG